MEITISPIWFVAKQAIYNSLKEGEIKGIFNNLVEREVFALSDSSQKICVTYANHLSRQVINCAKKCQHSIAFEFLEELESLPLYYKTYQGIINATLLPTKAYYFYCIGDFASSIQMLDQEREELMSGRLYHSKILCSLRLLQSQINRYKVVIACRHIEEALLIAQNIFNEIELQLMPSIGSCSEDWVRLGMGVELLVLLQRSDYSIGIKKT